MPEFISREEALERGIKRFMGRPCRNGHSGLRYTRFDRCVECSAATVKRFLARRPDFKERYRGRYKGRYLSRGRRDPSKCCRHCGELITARWAVNYCSKLCRNKQAYRRRKANETPQQKARKAELARQRDTTEYSTQYYLINRDDPIYRAKRRDLRRRYRRRAALALLALEELGILVQPVHGYPKRRTGMAIAALQAVKQLGIKIEGDRL